MKKTAIIMVVDGGIEDLKGGEMSFKRASGEQANVAGNIIIAFDPGDGAVPAATFNERFLAPCAGPLQSLLRK